MSRVVQVNRMPYLPEVWMVPATLADLECRHGELWPCESCDREAAAAALDRSTPSEPLCARGEHAAA